MSAQSHAYRIEELRAEDWPQVRDIYLEGITTGNATFETEAPEWDVWDREHLSSCRFVARDDDNRVKGWAALRPVSSRYAYRGVMEVSVYVTESARGRGCGRMLLEALISSSERNGIWTLHAGILAENTSSLELHRRCGFRVIGTRERIGKLHDRWRDVVLMERRSQTVGTD
ncbi:MAG TPA: GNAT family N-acetyltransferase [Pyrinomonadaceae bacterium]|nr:GNAT family N-acetyltransferase [Pyrinomonadaceae bacterium]